MHGDGAGRAGGARRASGHAAGERAEHDGAAGQRELRRAAIKGGERALNAIRLRFAGNLPQGLGPPSGLSRKHQRSKSWLYCRQRNRLSGSAAGVTLVAAFDAERAGIMLRYQTLGRAQSGTSLGRERGQQRTNLMDHPIASARAFGRALTVIVAAFGIGAALIVAPAAFAQQPKPAEKKAQAKPAAPAPAAPRLRSRRSRGLPVRPPKRRSSCIRRGSKSAARPNDPGDQQVCTTAKDGRLENGMPVAIVQLFEPKGEPAKFCASSFRSACSCAGYPHDHRPGSAGDRAVLDLLPGRLHGRLSGHRRHDRAR